MSISSSELAAWVQAIGSILALLATWVYIRYEKTLERRMVLEDRRLLAMTTAASLDTALTGYLEHLELRARHPEWDTDGLGLVERVKQTHLAIASALPGAHYLGSPALDRLIHLHQLFDVAIRSASLLTEAKTGRAHAVLADVRYPGLFDVATAIEVVEHLAAEARPVVDEIRTLIEPCLPKLTRRVDARAA